KLDGVAVADVRRWEEEFLDYIHTKKQNVWDSLDENKDVSAVMKKADNEVTQMVVAAIDEFNQSFK
ncbi:MAG: hypothetical protein GY880_01830, partial [Planctomycetaceae bacterium]|nr:hypothetical protein [Planctomycetaceae bacterium]